MLAGDGSHSTDQPGGTAKGQYALSAWFSTGIPESSSSKAEYNDTQQGLPGFGSSKAEYNDTQQGLPGFGYTLAHN
jgi:hypothetical protein